MVAETYINATDAVRLRFATGLETTFGLRTRPDHVARPIPMVLVPIGSEGEKPITPSPSKDTFDDFERERRIRMDLFARKQRRKPTHRSHDRFAEFQRQREERMQTFEKQQRFKAMSPAQRPKPPIPFQGVFGKMGTRMPVEGIFTGAGFTPYAFN